MKLNESIEYTIRFRKVQHSKSRSVNQCDPLTVRTEREIYNAQKRSHPKPRTIHELHPFDRRSELEIRRANKLQRPFMRINVLQREGAAFIKLRRLGYSMSIISEAFGRSTSIVWDRIRKSVHRGTIDWIDYRKMPSLPRLISHCRQWTRLMQWLPRWESWILGEGEKPP